MNTIGEKIKYLPATNDPLSAEVYCFDGEKYCYIYDVGNNNKALQYINQIEKDKIIILSHCHKDHIGNIKDIHYQNLYVGKETNEVVGTGIIVEDKIIIDDNVNIEITHCTSPHTDGSLIVTIDNEYTLIADLYFTRHPFDKKKAIKMIETLKEMDTKYFVISHLEVDKIVPKEQLTGELSEYFHKTV